MNSIQANTLASATVKALMSLAFIPISKCIKFGVIKAYIRLLFLLKSEGKRG
ncbi:hypothetical protein [Desulfosporosinus sp. Sb-LF]|uniref:hypothetical protein n=1 Tax=Desulfosporosinus sp. Sb-LF TaxID=2560027 RepID=UPI001305382F|nr:hypothetical protein [Desulfosporosinus sp. Sb-LF]